MNAPKPFRPRGSRLQRSGDFLISIPGALPQAGLGRAFGPPACVSLPLAEQRRIVAKVEQLMALVDALETQLAASRATAANLLAALVTELTTCV